MFELVVDVTCDLEDEFLEKENIQVVPLYIVLPEGRKIKIESRGDTEKFYRNKGLRKMWMKGKLKTSQPSIKDFLEKVRKFDKEKKIVIVTLSSKLSGTYNVATMAKKILEKEGYSIEVIDSLLTSYAMGFLIKDLVEIRKKGVFTKPNHKNYDVFFYPQDLEFLFSSGRISILKYGFLKISKLKPVFHLNEGRVEKYRLVKDPKESLRKIEEKYKITKKLSTEEGYLVNPILAVNVGPVEGLAVKLAHILAGQI